MVAWRDTQALNIDVKFYGKFHDFPPNSRNLTSNFTVCDRVSSPKSRNLTAIFMSAT